MYVTLTGIMGFVGIREAVQRHVSSIEMQMKYRILLGCKQPPATYAMRG